MSPEELEEEGDRLLEFARASVHPDGGFAWLSDDGAPELDRPVELWITLPDDARLRARAPAWATRTPPSLVDHGVAALTGRLRDHEHGGWWAAVGPDGPVTRSQDGLRARVRACWPRRRPRPPGGRARTRCWPTRWTSSTGASGTRTPAWSSRSGTRPGRRSTATAASTPTCTRVEALLAVGDAAARAERIADPGRARVRAREPLADARALRRRPGPPLPDYNRDRARPPVPAVRRDRRPLVRVEPADALAARRARRRPRPAGCSTTPGRCSTPACARAGRSTAPTGSSTPSTGTARRSCASGCTGCVAEALAAAATLHRATGDRVVRDLPRAVVGVRRAPPDRPRARLVAPRAGPGQPAGRGHLGREAGRLPRVPGDAGAATPPIWPAALARGSPWPIPTKPKFLSRVCPCRAAGSSSTGPISRSPGTPTSPG